MSKINIRNSDQRGFTIIEVVLVLAIAGLIFLIVFLALPQLQKSRRDTQRRNDAGKIISALESYSGNNNGNYPTGTAQAAFVAQYVTDQIENPEGNNYPTPTWVSTGAAPTTLAKDALHISVNGGTDCDGTALTNRQVAVRIGLEQGIYCQDSK